MRTPDGRRSRGTSPAWLLVAGPLFLGACAGEATEGALRTSPAALEPDEVFALSESIESGGSDFGHSVAIADELLAVGDPANNTVHVFRAEEGDYARVTALEGSRPDAGFGNIVQISGDAVIVAYDEGRVEAWAPDQGAWSVRAAWEPDISQPGEEFGSALWADDEMVIIGAAQGTDSASSAGSVFVIEGPAGEHQNWQRHVLSQSDRRFGKSVGFDGRWLAVGVENSSNIGTPRGGVMVFERFGVGDWSAGELVAVQTPGNNDRLGETVAVANGTIFVGFPHPDEPSAVHAFQHVEDSWQRTQAFDAPANAEHYFGSAIAAADGLLAISSRHNNEPVRYYRLEGTSWVEAGSIAEPIEIEKAHRFGWSLATDGSRLLVGSTGALLLTSPPSLGQGRAHVYVPGVPPDAPEELFTVYEDTPFDFDLAASDRGGGDLAYRFSALAVGRITRTETGWRYEPGKNWYGTDSFNYTVTNSLGLSTTSRLTFEIRPVNDPPVIKDEYLDCLGVPCRVVARLHTVDIDGDQISDYEVIGSPSHGRAEIRRGTLYYELDVHPDTPRIAFEVRVSDGMFWSEPAVVDIIVEGGDEGAAAAGERPGDLRPDGDPFVRASDSGCSSAGGNSPMSGWLLLLAFLARRRKS